MLADLPCAGRRIEPHPTVRRFVRSAVSQVRSGGGGLLPLTAKSPRAFLLRGLLYDLVAGPDGMETCRGMVLKIFECVAASGNLDDPRTGRIVLLSCDVNQLSR